MARSPLRACVLVLLLALPGGAAATAASGRQPALLDLDLNGVPKGELAVLVDGAAVWADVQALERAGLRVSGGTRVAESGREYVLLPSLAPDVMHEFDERTLALRIVARPHLLGHVTLTSAPARPAGIVERRAASAFLNYGAAWTSGGTRTVALESGATVGAGLAAATWSYDGRRVLRGLTSVTFDDRARLNRLVVGDAVAGTGALGGSLQLAGVSVSRDYTIDPYFVRHPSIGVSGSVLTPSRLEVYVNDQLVKVEELPPGTYELSRLPLPTGASDARLVLRDAFGGEQELSSSHYLTASVLARGLQQFQYAAGVERESAFDRSWDYGRPAVLGAHRVGVTDALTVGGRGEWARGAAGGGPLVAMRLARFGEAEVAAALSRSEGRTGAAISGAYAYSGRRAGGSIAVRYHSPEYATVSTAALTARPGLDAQASAHVRAGRRTSLAASWQSFSWHEAQPPLRRATASASVSIGRAWHLFVSGGRTRDAGPWRTTAYAGLTVGLGGRFVSGMTAEVDGGRVRPALDVQRYAPVGTGYGYRLRAGRAPDGRDALDAELRAQTPWGRADLRSSTLDGSGGAQLHVAGGLVGIGGRLFATRPVQDGFALVRVPGVGGVRAFVSHQEVGRTDANGDLLVPGLLPYYANRVSIADADVPIDRTLGANEQLVAPPWRGGTIATFEAAREWRVAGRLLIRDARETRVPANAHVRVESAGATIDTSLGGGAEFYIEGLAPGRHTATVDDGRGPCTFDLVVPDRDAPVIGLGTITCVVSADAGGDR